MPHLKLYAPWLIVAWCWFIALSICAETIILGGTPSSSTPCSGLFSLNGFAGCSSRKDNSQNVGDLRVFLNVDDFNNALGEGKFEGSWAIPTSVWCAFNKAIAESLNQLATSVIVYEESDNVAACLKPSRFDDKWNKLGSSVALSALNYPVTRLSREDSKTLLSIVDGVGVQRTRFEFYMGKTDGTITSKECLEMNRCKPLGGLSVWGTVRSPPIAPGSSAILLAASMDGSAFFQDQSFGFHASGGDIAVLMAATRALADEPVTSTRIISAFFQGEAFSRIGSRRFVDDIIGGECKSFSSSTNQSCADPPNFSLEYLKFEGQVSRIMGVVALSNVLRMDLNPNASTIFVPDSPSSTSELIADRLKLELANLGLEEPPVLPKALSELPPSALSSFVERNEWLNGEGTGGVLVAGYQTDISEANPRFQTEEDVMNLDALETYVDRASNLATALARAVYFVASNGTVASSVTADSSLVKTLLLCFGANFVDNCTLAQSALNMTENQLRSRISGSSAAARSPFELATMRPLISYTSVYSPLGPITGRVKIREEFIRSVLANLTLGGTIPPPRTSEPFQRCAVDATCRDSWPGILDCPGTLATNGSVACVGGRCVCSTTFYQEAWSTKLQLDLEENKFKLSDSTLPDPVWTEPNWESESISVFTASADVDIAVSLVMGLILTLGTFFLVRFAKNKQDATGKFKLA